MFGRKKKYTESVLALLAENLFWKFHRENIDLRRKVADLEKEIKELKKNREI